MTKDIQDDGSSPEDIDIEQFVDLQIPSKPVSIPQVTKEYPCIESHKDPVVFDNIGFRFSFCQINQMMSCVSSDQKADENYLPKNCSNLCDQNYPSFEPLFAREGWKHCSFDGCATYPRQHFVPQKTMEEDLTVWTSLFQNGRFPSAYYHNIVNDVILIRSACPLLGKENSTMELLQQFAGNRNIKIYDLRSKRAAIAGICAGRSYLNNATFLGLPNIYAVQRSLGTASEWVARLQELNTAVMTIVQPTYRNTVILTHCTDGWDRTTQVVSLMLLHLEPHYRTTQGFKDLIQTHWVDYGHQFALRHNIDNDSQHVSPVFLQFIAIVRTYMQHSPKSFQFGEEMLDKLMTNAYDLTCVPVIPLFDGLPDRCENAYNCEPLQWAEMSNFSQKEREFVLQQKGECGFQML